MFDVLSAREPTAVTPDAVEAILVDLLAHDLSCAPHVVSLLISELTADADTIREVVVTLDPAQRQGLRSLPSPLPMVSAIANLYEGLELAPRDRELLIAASLCLGDDLEPLLSFDGRSADDLATSSIADKLRLHAGRARLTDPRLNIWIRANTSAAEAVSIHERLFHVFHEREAKVDADWHRARASISGDPEAAAELIRIARELSEAGFADRALQLASEAAAHAHGAARDDAKVVAGVSAISAGYAAEASAWLGSLFPDGAEQYRLQGLGGLFIAQAHIQGAVPAVDPAAFRPSTDDPVDWHSWAQAAAFAAVLSAERGDRAGMRVWLSELREACARVGAERELRDPVVSLAWLLAGDSDVDVVAGTGPLSGDMLQALSAALDGDIDRGLRWITVGDSGISAEGDPFVAGFEHSPVVGAYRAVVEVLLLMWRGDIRAARDRMMRAAAALPVTLPFGGLGAVLARRLDLAILGELGPFGIALTRALPPALRIDQLVDRGIRCYLGGSFDEASAVLKLWIDSGSPQPTLAVPGLETAILVSYGATPADTGIGPPEVVVAQQLGARITGMSNARWRTEKETVIDEVRSLSSPFTRARIEMMLGVRAVVSADIAAARAHLSTAQSLFDVAGATAWARAVKTRLTRLSAEDQGAEATRDPLSSCRQAWESRLTARELEVAMLAVAGVSNRGIAERLLVSIRTVEVHLGRVFAKLDVRNRIELTVLAHRVGQYL